MLLDVRNLALLPPFVVLGEIGHVVIEIIDSSLLAVPPSLVT